MISVQEGTTRPPLVDSHAHVTAAEFDSDHEAVIERARAAGLRAIVTVGFEPGDWQSTLDLARQYDLIYAAFGIHPNSADQMTADTLHDLGRLLSSETERAVAIGETGLDYYRDYVSKEAQQEAFREQLALARELDLPVIIHTRDAHEDVMTILKRDGGGTRGVMHSFSGDLPYAEECIRLGYKISLSGPVTFRKAADKHEIARSVPLAHLLVETDCPYLSPEPFRGRRNEPAYVAYTVEAIARIRGISIREVSEATTANACRLFGLKL